MQSDLSTVVGGQAFIQRRIGGNVPFRLRGSGTPGIRFHDGQQAHRRAFALQSAPDTKMIAAEGAGPADKNAEMSRAGQRSYAGFPSTTRRQRVYSSSKCVT